MLITLLPTAAWTEGPVLAYITEDITTNTTWPAGDYYICKTADNREPRITNGATLTIESGANVYFSTKTTTEIPESDGKYPYSSLTVTNGSLVSNGVTFTTVPDAAEKTTWRDAGWNGIQAIGLPEGATSLSFTNCTFEYSGFTDAGTLHGNQTNSVNSEVNISVSGCVFICPKAGATAIRYANGHNTVGTGAISVSNSSFFGYGRGVQVLDNQEDAVNTTVTGCTFSGMSVRPLEINGGRQASVTGCTFDTFVAGQPNGAVLIFDTHSATSETQTVKLTGNTFNYGSGANIYPVMIGAGTKINENLATTANNTFDTSYPEAYRYIELTRGVGYSNRHRVAVWGDTGIPYLLASEITITGTDETNHSSLTIKPGVTVCLGDGTGADNLAVRGALMAEGTADKPITFTKKIGVTYGNEISAGNSLKGSIVLKHCIMDGLYRGIGITSPGNAAGSSILLENCTVRNTQHSMYLAGLNVSVKNCTLIGKGLGIGGGQYVNSISIEGCSITASGTGSGNGISLEPTKSVVLKNCLIAGFSNYGIAVMSNGYKTLEDGAPLIENCTVTGNGHGVVFSRGFSSAYGAFIRNSIIADNAGLDLANKAYTSGDYNYPVTIADGSIAYSLIGDDGASFPFSLSYYDHPTLGKIHRITSPSYSNRVTGDPLFADAANGDYHLQSTVGRWDGSAWVNDDATSPCIDAGDPASLYGNEPEPNGAQINIGCYGNTTQASKSTGGGIPDTTPPSWRADSTLTASAITQVGATLSWSGASDDTAVTAYRIYQDGTLIQTTSNMSYAVSGLSPDTDYSFKVEAGDAAGNWSINGPTTPVCTLEEATPSVTVTANPSGNVSIGTTVTLTATPTGIAGPSYQWYSNTTDSSTGGSEISGATNATYQPFTASVGTTYYYCVVSSVTSNVAGVTVTSIPPVTHSITATAGANGSISPSGAVTVSHGGSQQFTITPNTSYRIDDVRIDGSSVGAVSSYTFSNVTADHTITASFVYDDSPYTPPPVTEIGSTTIITIPEKKPDQPAAATVSVSATAGVNGIASVAMLDKAITDAIAKAQSSAKAQGKDAFAVELDVTMPKGATSLTATLSQKALQSLVSAGVTSLDLNGAPVSVSFDKKAIGAILSQSCGNVTISITPVKTLSDSAKALVGNRPVYEITVSFVKDVKTTGILNFNGGILTLAIPYTLGKNEASSYLYGVYVDGNGKATRITSSAYDAKAKAVLIPATHLSVYGIGYTAPSAKFADIANHWGKESIDYVVGRGLFSGTSDTAFTPDTAMGRGMLITVLGRLSGAAVSGYRQNSFTDVATDKYYAPYIEWAYKKGIIQGIGNSQFAPDRAVTREEIAVIFTNYAKATGYKLPVTREATAYEDDSSIGSVYRTAVTAMQQAGIMMGGSGNKFNPKAGATRAEVAAMIHRYVKLTIEPDTAQGWALNDASQWFYYKYGKALTGEQTIDSVKYYFYDTGALQTGWVKTGDNWRFYDGNKMLVGWWNIGSDTAKQTYYFDTYGNMVSGKWLQIDSKWYYFNADGSLARSTTVDGQEVDANGVRKPN
jgi:hypothetical protein